MLSSAKLSSSQDPMSLLYDTVFPYIHSLANVPMSYCLHVISCLSLNIYIYIYIYIYISICIYIYKNVYNQYNVYIYTYLYIYIQYNMYICIYIYIFINSHTVLLDYDVCMIRFYRNVSSPGPFKSSGAPSRPVAEALQDRFLQPGTPWNL